MAGEQVHVLQLPQLLPIVRIAFDIEWKLGMAKKRALVLSTAANNRNFLRYYSNIAYTI